jgi:predicted nucleic acid-binding Zn ribbon protein
MSEKLLQHKHCRYCEKAITLKEDYCSQDCRLQHQMMMKKKRNQLYILMAIAMGIMLVTLFMSG